MNERTKEKLKMHRPEFYDATENRVAVAQEHSLIDLFRNARREGGSIGVLFGSTGIFLSTMFTLESTQAFQAKFGVPAASWQAIFTIVAWASFAAMVVSFAFIATRFFRKKLFSEDVVKEKFFSDEKKMKS